VQHSRGLPAWLPANTWASINIRPVTTWTGDCVCWQVTNHLGQLRNSSVFHLSDESKSSTGLFIDVLSQTQMNCFLLFFSQAPCARRPQTSASYSQTETNILRDIFREHLSPLLVYYRRRAECMSLPLSLIKDSRTWCASACRTAATLIVPPLPCTPQRR